MVRAKRAGAREQLAAAQAEIAKLRAALANPTAAVHEMMSQAPGGITILGTEPPNITGGMTRREHEEKVFGRKWWVKITELALPQEKDVQQVASYCRAGEFIRTFRAGDEVLLPESEISKIENDSVVMDRILANIGEGAMDVAGAKAYNTGMSLVRDTTGQYWFERRMPRFIVQRLRPEQESVSIS